MRHPMSHFHEAGRLCHRRSGAAKTGCIVVKDAIMPGDGIGVNHRLPAGPRTAVGPGWTTIRPYVCGRRRAGPRTAAPPSGAGQWGYCPSSFRNTRFPPGKPARRAAATKKNAQKYLPHRSLYSIVGCRRFPFCFGGVRLVSRRHRSAGGLSEKALVSYVGFRMSAIACWTIQTQPCSQAWRTRQQPDSRSRIAPSFK